MTEKPEQDQTVRIELTEEQREQIRQRTGQDAKAIEFTADELEERIAPFGPTGT